MGTSAAAARIIRLDPPDPTPTSAESSAEWAALTERAGHDPVAALVVRMRAEASSHVDATVRRIRQTVDRYVDDGIPVERDDLWQSVFRNLDAVLLALGSQRPLTEAELGPRRELGRTRAQQGMPLEDVMRAFRVGYTALWESLSQLAAKLGEEYAQALLERAAHVWATFDQVTSAVADAHRSVRDSQHLDRRRRALALLSGLQHHPEQPAQTAQTEAVARTFGFEPAAAFACAVMAPADRCPPPERDLLVVEQPDRFVVIAAVGGEPSAAEASLAGLLRRRGFTAIGVGIMRQGLSGARQSLADAEWAHALARVTGAPATLYRESWLACMALQHQGQLDLLVAPAVRTLQDDDELAQTLEAFLVADGNLTGAGRALYLHANTVGYRLRQFAARTGIDVRTPTGMALGQVALIHARLAAPPVGG